jgi:hypothetical protein
MQRESNEQGAALPRLVHPFRPTLKTRSVFKVNDYTFMIAIARGFV